MPRRSILSKFFAAICLLLFAAATPAWSSGYWNMPSTFCQCIGCGYGAGHHAPLMLGPITIDPWQRHGEIRMPHSPAPHPYGANGCGDCGGQFGEPALFAPSVLPAAPQLYTLPPGAHRQPLRR